MIGLKEVKADDTLCLYIKELYEEAFPSDERRDFVQWLQLLDSRPEFRAFAICDDCEPVGFITVWQLGGWRYAEHFAVDSSRRGGGIGATAFGQLLRMDTRPLILEVELPADSISRRRISFYERQGMTIHRDFDYIQPPYSPEKHPLPMKLMTCGVPADTDLSEPASLIHRHVYGHNQK